MFSETGIAGIVSNVILFEAEARTLIISRSTIVGVDYLALMTLKVLIPSLCRFDEECQSKEVFYFVFLVRLLL